MVLIPSRWPGLLVNEDRVIADEGALSESWENDAYGIAHLDNVEYALDVGAHVGGAAALLHKVFPMAQIVAVECCPENIPALRANVGGFAEAIQAAVTYESGDLILASTVYEGCRTTGSSVVVRRERWDLGIVPWTWYADDYHLDERPLVKITIEEIMSRFSMPRLDFMKLDCEGSETSILHNCTMLDRIRIIAGEYHNDEAGVALELPGRRLETWDGHLFRSVRIGP